MKFTISKATFLALAQKEEKMKNLLLEEIEGSSPCDYAAAVEKKLEFVLQKAGTYFANFTITEVNGEIVLEANDEGLFKMYAIYLKVVKFVKPFIKPFMGLFEVLRDDISEIERFMSQPK